MKKLFAVLTAVILAASLAACDPNPNGETIPTRKQNVDSSTEAVPTESLEEPTEEPTEGPTDETPVTPVSDLNPLIPDGTVVTDSLAYCLLDGEGNAVITKNALQHLKPADLSKVLTALIIYEECDLSEEVTVSESAARTIVTRSWFTTPALRPGEVFTVDDLLHLMIVDSCDAAANALAEHLSVRIPAFAEVMNTRAAALGMSNSKFTNPTGLDENGQYTCAYDMALLMKKACEIDYLKELMSIEAYTVSATNYSAAREITRSRRVMTGDLANESFFACNDGKTAGGKGCYMAAAERNGATLYGATLYSADYLQCFDTRNLFEYAFARVTGAKKVTPLGYVYNVRLSESYSPVLTFEKATGTAVTRVIYWSVSEGTEKAVYLDEIYVEEEKETESESETEPETDEYGKTVKKKETKETKKKILPQNGEDGFKLNFTVPGFYIIQVATTLADGTTSYQIFTTLFRNAANVNSAINRFNDKNYYINDHGFIETGVIMTPTGCRLADDEGAVYFDGIYSNVGTFYVNSDGVIESGWKEINGQKYFFGSDGQMATGKMIIGNREYEFNQYGVLISQ